MNLSEDVLKVMILLETLYKYYTIIIINFGRKRRREIGNWASTLQDMNRSGVMVNNTSNRMKVAHIMHDLYFHQELILQNSSNLCLNRRRNGTISWRLTFSVNMTVCLV